MGRWTSYDVLRNITPRSSNTYQILCLCITPVKLNNNDMIKFPEHDKLKEVSMETQAIGEFMEWLGSEKCIQLAQYDDKYMRGEFLKPVSIPINTLMAEYYGIDLKILEEEKQQMLEKIRQMNK